MSNSLNKVLLIGRLGRDPDLRALPSNVSVCELSVATDHKGRTEETSTTTWHKVIVYGRPGEKIADLATKGSLVYIEGRISMRKYTDREKRERTVFEVIADRAVLLSGQGGLPVLKEPHETDGVQPSPTAKDLAASVAKKNIRQPSFDDDEDVPF